MHFLYRLTEINILFYNFVGDPNAFSWKKLRPILHLINLILPPDFFKSTILNILIKPIGMSDANPLPQTF